MQVLERTGVLRLFSVSRSLALRPGWACAAIFLITLLLRSALLPWFPVPKPVIHDEFSYLLAADTYAHGRLANPTHPMWQHFETFQELQQPTYSSKYQPLQGMALAFGEKFFGEPWVGVLFSTALACAAICWMLQGWISGEWALLGAFLFALRVGVLSYWMNSYEGGSVPAIGGALALGAMGRLWGHHDPGKVQPRHAVTWAIGICILALSRPYDGAVIAISSAAILVYLLRTSVRSLIRAAVPALAVFGVTLAAIGYNDYRVTGSAFSLPYQVHDNQYLVASPLLLIPLRPEPVYHHAVMRDFFARWSVDLWKESQKDILGQFLGKVYIQTNFFFGLWPITVPLLLSPFAFKSPRERICAILFAACLASIAPLAVALPHYVSAFSGVFYLRFLQSLRRLATWKPAGPLLAFSIPALFVVAVLNSAFGLLRGGHDLLPFAAGRDSLSTTFAEQAANFGAARDAMDRELASFPGEQLVLVRYRPGHTAQNEWVFNHADIDSQRVIWAREMNPAADAPLLDYYRGRHIWLAEPDNVPPRLTPYSGQPQPLPPKISAKPALAQPVSRR